MAVDICQAAKGRDKYLPLFTKLIKGSPYATLGAKIHDDDDDDNDDDDESSPALRRIIV